jgi:hypothetical protein
VHIKYARQPFHVFDAQGSNIPQCIEGFMRLSLIDGFVVVEIPGRYHFGLSEKISGIALLR